jgi:hypothetical protein
VAAAVKAFLSLVNLSMSSLTDKIRKTFGQFTDIRQGGANQQYEVSDAALSAFSVFFTQSPSFLDAQTRVEQGGGKSNAQTIFGVHKTPSDNQIRNLLDPVPPQQVYPLMTEIAQGLHELGCLDQFRVLNNQLLIAMDGTDVFSSEKICCKNCSTQQLKNGKTLHRHIVITPVIVAPGQARVVPLPPEFVTPQDGHEKQDCEIRASMRWLLQHASDYAPWGCTILGDDLYCHQPFCEAVLVQKMHFILTCKPQSHELLYEWVSDQASLGHRHTVQQVRKIGKQQFTDTYAYVNLVPLRDSDDALMVNWCELRTTDALGKVIFYNAWATSHNITDANVAEIALAGRTRWKIENENNNTLKNQGYHLTHNFGHGKEHLSNLLTTLNLLAYLTHTTLDWFDQRYRAIRARLPSRCTFFENLRTLLLYLTFESWDHLMEFMLRTLSIKRSNAPENRANL